MPQGLDHQKRFLTGATPRVSADAAPDGAATPRDSRPPWAPLNPVHGECYAAWQQFESGAPASG